MKRALIIFMSLLVFGCVSDETVEIPSYLIIDENLSESNSKTSIELNALITDDDVNEIAVRNLLTHLYDSVMNTTGYKFHDSPNSCNIFLYLTKEHHASGMGQWIGRISKARNDNNPTIDIGKEQFNQVNQKADVLNGLSLEKRQEIWRKIIEAEQKSSNLAEERYPIKLTGNQHNDPNQVEKQRARATKNSDKHYGYEAELTKGFLNTIVAEYQISEETLKSVSDEGLSNGWPFPKNDN